MSVDVDTIVKWFQEECSPEGVEVGSVGKRSLTVSVPADLALTELCAEVWNRFGATCELRQGVSASGGASIVVWLPKNNADDGRSSHCVDPPKERRDIMRAYVLPAMSLVACMMAQSAWTAFVKPEDPNATITDWFRAGVRSFSNRVLA